MNILKRLNKNKDKITFYYDLGRGRGQRPSTNVFIYTKPKNQVEKNHNKEAQQIVASLRSQATLDQQAVGAAYIPNHKLKSNFVEYYEKYVRQNKVKGNRALEGSFNKFKEFIQTNSISATEITENFCQRFRQFLLDKHTGETPADYFARFKQVLKTATKEGYYRTNPCADVKAKKGKPGKLKENLEVTEYLSLLRTPCLHREVQEAFIFSCYTGLRWCDVKRLNWANIKGDQLETQIVQTKTGVRLVLTLHPIAKAILERREKYNVNKLPRVFSLPSHDGARKIIAQWCKNAGISKHITWHCARLSFAILLQDAKVDAPTVALLLGHTSTKHVNEIYKRHRPKDQSESINHLPSTCEFASH